MENSEENENNVTLNANVMDQNDKPETDESESEAIRELIRMDLAEKEVLNIRINTTSPNDTKPGAYERIQLSKKEEELLNDVQKQINTLEKTQSPNDEQSELEAIQDLLRTDLAMKQSEADHRNLELGALRPILRPSHTPDPEDTDSTTIHDDNNSISEKHTLIEAKLVEEQKPSEPVFEAQQVDEDEIESHRRRVRAIIVTSIILTLISVVVVVSLVLRFVVFQDAPNVAPTPSLPMTLSPTPHLGTTLVPKGQFIQGTIEDESLGMPLALSNDGSLLALTSGGNFDLGPLQGSFQMYWFDEALQQWVPRGSRIVGKTAFDQITKLAFSGDGAVFAGRISSTRTVRTYEWHETTNDWSERYGNITADHLSISDDGSVLATVSPQTDEQPNGAIIELQKWNETENSWIQLGKTVSIGEQWGQSGQHIVRSISLDPSGARFAAGVNGPLEDTSSWGDSVWVYAWNGSDWTLLGDGRVDFSEEVIRSVDCSFECRNIAVTYRSSKVTVFAWNANDSTLETKGQPLTGLNTTDDFFGIRSAISNDGNRLALMGRRYVLAYEWLPEINSWNEVGARFDQGNPTMSRQELYAADFCMSGDGSTIALVDGNADFVNASHTISKAGRVEVYEWPSS